VLESFFQTVRGIAIAREERFGQPADFRQARDDFLLGEQRRPVVLLNPFAHRVVSHARPVDGLGERL